MDNGVVKSDFSHLSAVEYVVKVLRQQSLLNMRNLS